METLYRETLRLYRAGCWRPPMGRAEILLARFLRLAGVGALVLALAGCGVLVPMCDDRFACERGADGTWRCPPPGGMVCADGEIHGSCVDHGGDYCRVPY